MKKILCNVLLDSDDLRKHSTGLRKASQTSVLQLESRRVYLSNHLRPGAKEIAVKKNIQGSSPRAQTSRCLSMHIIREYGSTLYAGLARAVSPTNTNFRLIFLLTRLQEALYEDLAV